MPHKDIDVAGSHLFVGPDDGVIAHFDGGVGLIGGFVDAGQDVDVWPGAFVVGIPFLFLYDKGVGYPFHDGAGGVFDVDGSFCKSENIIFPADAAHKI